MKKLMIIILTVLLCAFTVVHASEITEREKNLDFLYETLKESHPNIFYSTSEKEFIKRKAEIKKNINEKSNVEYALDLQSLVAMVNDSHTNVNTGPALKDVNIYPFSIRHIETWVLDVIGTEYEEYLGWEIVALNGYDMKTVKNKMASIISHDNDVWLQRQLRQIINVKEILDYVGIIKDDELEITVKKENQEKTISLHAVETSADTVDVVYLAEKRSQQPKTTKDKSKIYFSMPLDGNVYYIQYNACKEDKNLPMETFSLNVQKDLESNEYETVVIDLRNNTGGSDGVIMPLLYVLTEYQKNNDIQIVGLIGENTFSSATINVMMIKEMGGILVGTYSGGSVDHYGAVDQFELPHLNIQVGHSTKYIEIDSLFDSGIPYGIEPIKPDIIKEQTYDDYIKGIDTAVHYIENNTGKLQANDDKSLYISRGKLAHLLYTMSLENNQPLEYAKETPKDVFFFTYYEEASRWAVKNNIIVGKSSNVFAPSDLLTREELAVVLDRFVSYLNMEPAEKQQLSYSDGKDISIWAKDSVQKIVNMGYLELENEKFNPKSHITIEKLENILENIK
ncbi:S-layer homology domain-containing protein [Tissierella sp. MB52-C2]|uniref:S-layer homology domain-containing protein n=1 Tax=Tissierella sp. MB52-C2 TaxID=3070999 RepID=UPI00280B1ECA|nr:S-layer homology domain-containing protein [Tissierella sp. MB52-C2]WMM26278.1 S-layer homology domain-containing protein [Tissierella sp. MB52-C2]